MNSVHDREDTELSPKLLPTGGEGVWVVKKIVVASFILIMLLLGAVGWFSFRHEMKMEHAVFWVDHSGDVVTILKALELDVREAEVALQTYLSTRDVRWRDEFRLQAFDEMSSHLARLQELIGDSPNQPEGFGRVEALTQKRVSIFQALQASIDDDPSNNDRRSALMQSGANETEQMVSVINTFVERENHAIENRLAQRKVDGRRLKEMILAVEGFALAFVGGALILVYRAVRTRDEAENQLKLSLNEKEMLLKEVHHRVKNNLQVVSSLLCVQSEKLKDREAWAVFAECRDRIHSMARMHELVCARGQFASVEFDRHLRDIAEILLRSHMPADCDIVLVARCDRVDLDLDQAITLGLIANELILNSLKHGFAGRSKGTLAVELHAGPPCEMVVRDDGIGLPTGFDSGKGIGLGLELALGLTRQLKGELKTQTEAAPGTSITVRFPTKSKNTPAIPASL